jgi:hypothetical protein
MPVAAANSFVPYQHRKHVFPMLIKGVRGVLLAVPDATLLLLV